MFSTLSRRVQKVAVGGYFSTSVEILHISAWLASNLGSPATGVEGLSWIPIKLCQFVKYENGKYIKCIKLSQFVKYKHGKCKKVLMHLGTGEGVQRVELWESGKWGDLNGVWTSHAFFLQTLSLRWMGSSGLLSKTEPADEIFKEWSNYSLNPLNSPNLDA